MKKIIIFAFGLVLAFSSCSDAVDLSSDLEKVVSDLDSLSQRVNDLEARMDRVEELDITQAVLDIADIQVLIASNSSSSLDSIQALKDQLNALADDLNNNVGSGDASAVYWGDVRNAKQYTELQDGNYTKITGTVDVTSIDHVALLQDIEYIGGDLNIDNIVGETSFAALAKLSGSVNIGVVAEGASLEFPNLTFINGGIYATTVSIYLETLSLPVLSTVIGDVSFDFSDYSGNIVENVFSSISVPQLLLVGGDFNIIATSLLSTIEMPTVYIGGDFIIFNNSILSLGKSNFADVEYIGGSLSFQDNFMSREDDMIESDLCDVIWFENLNYLGYSVTIKGSCDIYNLSGFSKLEQIYGDVSFGLSSNGLGYDVDVKVFNSLTQIDGSLIVVCYTPKLSVAGDESEKYFIDGFDNLIEVGQDVNLASKEIYGFDKLVYSGRNSDVSSFALNANLLPKFSSFVTTLSGFHTTFIISTNAELTSGIFPVMTPIVGTSIYNVDLIIDLQNETKAQTFKACFKSVTALYSLHIENLYGVILSEGTLGELNSVGGYLYNEGCEFKIHVTGDTDLSSLATYFKAKAAENYIADSLFIVETVNYQKALEYYEAGQISVDQLRDAMPQDHTLQTDSIFLYEHSPSYVNHADTKITESSDVPALLQAFKTYGKFEDYSDLPYYKAD